MIRIAYIILNYKTFWDTELVTKELLSFIGEDDTIVIVDNCSHNESSAELHKLYENHDHVLVIDAPENGGYAKGNNYGLRYVKKMAPRFVCVMNNDVHFSQNTIEQLCLIYDKLEKPAIISPIQVLPDGKRAKFIEFKVPDLFYDLRMNTLFFKPRFQIYKSNTQWPNVQKVGYLPGAMLFTDYKVFERIGFFDESTFLFCEERFTGKAVQEAGLNNYVILDLEYLHEHSKTIKNEASSKKQRQMINEGRLKFYERYSRFPSLAKLLLKLSFHFHELELYIVSIMRFRK